MRIIGDDVREGQARPAMLGVKNLPPKVQDRSGRVLTGGEKAKRGAKIDELWFDRV
jgi:hypothetical protein